MKSLNVSKLLSVAAGFAATCCLAMAAAPDSALPITYSAAGTFATSPVSGNDTLKLSGQQFSLMIMANTKLEPVHHGRNWGRYFHLKMTGTVYSGLIPGQAIQINSSTTILQQTVGASEDIFQCSFPVTVVGIPLNVTAVLLLPGGTLPNPHLNAFASVALDPSNATVTYSNTTASTTLAVQTGTVDATTSSSSVTASAAPAPALVGLPDIMDALKPRIPAVC